jgi:hypothetical protein
MGDRNRAAYWLPYLCQHCELFGGCGRLRLGARFAFCPLKPWFGEQETWAPPPCTCLLTQLLFQFYYSAELSKTPKATSPLWRFLNGQDSEDPGTDHIPAIPHEHICSDLCRPDLLTSKLSRCAPLSTEICVRVLTAHEPEAGVR